MKSVRVMICLAFSYKIYKVNYFRRTNTNGITGTTHVRNRRKEEIIASLPPSRMRLLMLVIKPHKLSQQQPRARTPFLLSFTKECTNQSIFPSQKAKLTSSITSSSWSGISPIWLNNHPFSLLTMRFASSTAFPAFAIFERNDNRPPTDVSARLRVSSSSSAREEGECECECLWASRSRPRARSASRFLRS